MKSDTHIVPLDDLITHDEHRACWCGPDIDELERGALVTHHSADGREEAERVDDSLTDEAEALTRARLLRAS